MTTIKCLRDFAEYEAGETYEVEDRIAGQLLRKVYNLHKFVAGKRLYVGDAPFFEIAVGDDE